MKNKLKLLFEAKKSDILSIYFTAGHPYLESTGLIIERLQNSGVDFIEAGMPFSDPMADGPTIQDSSAKALQNGMNLDVYFSQLQLLKNKISIPVIAMGYVNQMLRYGVDNFLKKCSEAGISALIMPDLPLEIYREEYREKFEKYSLENIFLITPQTSVERIREIDYISDSFIYMVSSSSTTGSAIKSKAKQVEYYKKISELSLKNPVVTGFGISDRESYQTACKYSSGAIIGSAFVKHLESEGGEKIEEFIGSIRG